ncbi:MAG: hypothetical protein ACFFEV_07675 [Candidatus Thorarchaeota archaeon]
MDSDCPDGYCKQKIQAVDDALGHTNSGWATLLDATSNYDDVKQALRFCETFKLEASVSVLDDGFEVKVRSDVIKDLRTLSSKMNHGNLYDKK